MAPATDSRSRSASPPPCGPPSVLFTNSAIWQYVASPSAWPWPPPAVPAGRRPATGSSPPPRTTADRAPASAEVPWVLRATKRQSKETWANREEWLRSDDTDARKEACRCVGRSDDPEADNSRFLRSIRPKRATATPVFETDRFYHSRTPPSLPAFDLLRYLWISEMLMAGVDILLVARMAGAPGGVVARGFRPLPHPAYQHPPPPLPPERAPPRPSGAGR